MSNEVVRQLIIYRHDYLTDFLYILTMLDTFSKIREDNLYLFIYLNNNPFLFT